MPDLTPDEVVDYCADAPTSPMVVPRWSGREPGEPVTMKDLAIQLREARRRIEGLLEEGDRLADAVSDEWGDAATLAWEAHAKDARACLPEHQNPTCAP